MATVEGNKSRCLDSQSEKRSPGSLLGDYCCLCRGCSRPRLGLPPKVGARKPGLQRGQQRAVAALGRKGRGGEGFSFLPLRKRKPRLPVLSRKVSK